MERKQTRTDVSEDAQALMRALNANCSKNVLFSKAVCIFSDRARAALNDAKIPYIDVQLDFERRQPLRQLGVSGKPYDDVDGIRVQYAIHDMLVYQGMIPEGLRSKKMPSTVPQFFEVDCTGDDGSRTRYVYRGDSEAICQWVSTLTPKVSKGGREW